MPPGARVSNETCARCLRAVHKRSPALSTRRHFSHSTQTPLSHSSTVLDDGHKRRDLQDDRVSRDSNSNNEGGAMTRRLEAISESNLEEGGRGAQKAIEESGFDSEVKDRLLQRLAGADFRATHPGAFAQANLPSSAGKETRQIAASQPWEGSESMEDAALRMLNDSIKPLRAPSRQSSPQRPPKRVDTGRPSKAPSKGTRLANARDRSSHYSYLKDDSLSQEEKDKFRKELKERFAPGARAIPSTIQGLASLANERIEDAIARGQFKNLPRGKPLERDYNMSSPFLDTTEYFMNKIIQRQEIVPPWIEKQQELVSTATKFRSRLRNDWKRHAARMIASRGGSLASQIKKAQDYAAAEAIVNPPATKKVETFNTVDNDGHMSQIILSGELRVPASDPNADQKDSQSKGQTNITVTEYPVTPERIQDHATSAPTFDDSKNESPNFSNDSSTSPPNENRPPEDVASTANSNPNIVNGVVFTFRDPDWLKTEQAYLTAAVENLNNITRTYNLMAPNLAKKPYFSLERELRSCYADVAPQLAGEIHERATAPPLKIEIVGHRPGSILDSFATGDKAKVYDERRPQYGFKEFWKDLFGARDAR